ncbi:MAG: hypothetical protein WA058_01885 [Minisyncoccia bacterium]
MKDKVNSYLGMVLILIVAGLATWFIVHVATTSTITTKVGGNEAKYAPLQESILGQ